MKNRVASFVLLSSICWDARSLEPASKFSIDSGRSEYVVDADGFKLGYTAALLATGQNLGAFVRTPGSPTRPISSDNLADVMANARAEAERVTARSTTNTRETLRTLKHGRTPGVPPGTVTPDLPAETLDPNGNDFGACLRDALELLKQRRRSTRATKVSPAVDGGLTVQLDRRRGRGGIFCARGVERLELAVVSDELEMIKLLAAILARSGAERERLISVASLAYSPESVPELTVAWRRIWRRLAVAAVFETGPLPGWARLLEDLDPAETRVTFSDPREIPKVQMDTVPFRELMKSGLMKIGESTDAF